MPITIAERLSSDGTAECLAVAKQDASEQERAITARALSAGFFK